MSKYVPHLLYLVSGFTALVYEVFWMRQSGLVFGDTAQAAATTLAIFFAGIAIGSGFWGGRVERMASPLRAYAMLELAVAGSALGYFVLPAAYSLVYAPAVERLGHASSGLMLIRVAVTTILLLPAAIFMGGTFPVMAQVLARSADRIGRTGTLLYAINTFGGALGAFLAAFYLPIALGFARAYLLTQALTLAVAAGAFIADRARIGFGPESGDASVGGGRTPLDAGLLLGVAFVSGFAALSLEVLWTRMFAQVLHNSVYSFGLILVTFLLSMGLGGALAHALARRRADGVRVLFVSTTAGAALIGLTPFVFDGLTGGMQYVSPSATWSGYLWSVFGHAAAVMLAPLILIGSIFPYLLKLAERPGAAAGAVIGRIAAANTLGAVTGSMIAGFVLIPWIGLWTSIRAVSTLYLLLAGVIGGRKMLSDWRALPLFGLALIVVLLDSSRLPMIRTGKNETVRQIWESGQAVVAVIDTGENRVIKVDNYYSLGGTAARQYEETQADLPILLHPHPRSVFFLGLGTGITAGAALRHPVTEVFVAELIPEVVTAAKTYFEDYLNGLFTDARAEVVVADGRQELAATTRQYDVIIADLFIPWRAGAASLYSREHFEIVRRRLRNDGIFAQWLPLYQLSKPELFTIARTMSSVFPQVTVWRGDFLAQRPIVALIGAVGADQSLDPEAVTANYRQRRRKPDITRQSAMAFVGLFYGGNLTASANMFADYPMNTDDMPIIEYAAPVTQRLALGGRASWFTSSALLAWYEALAANTPPERDPYLRHVLPDERDSIRAGLALFKANVAKAQNDPRATAAATEEFDSLAPAEIGSIYREHGDDSQAESP